MLSIKDFTDVELLEQTVNAEHQIDNVEYGSWT